MSDCRVSLTVTDDSGKPIAFRAELWGANEPAVAATWAGGGKGQLVAPAGKYALVVRRGFDYDAVDLPIELKGDVAKSVVLKKRFDAQAMGWYCGESHIHGQHGKEDPPFTFEEAATKCEGDGLDFLQVAFAWEKTFSWIPSKELEAWSKRASKPGVHITWNIETPKCYFSEDHGGRKGNLHCMGHGWTVALRNNDKGLDFFDRRGPAYKIIQEIHEQGAVVGCAHPLRSGFSHHGNFVSNWASELPFDYVAGAGYDALDILNDSPKLFFQSEALWHNLLNMGYKVAAAGNSDGAVGASAPGRYRTYVKVDGAFTFGKAADAIRDNATIASSGPFVQFEVDGKGPGAEFPADGKRHTATVQAWSGPLVGEKLVSVQVLRNGEVIQAWNLREQNLRQWQGSFELGDKEYAWYTVRVSSLCRDRRSCFLWGEHCYEVAVPSAVFFMPRGYKRPQAAVANVKFEIADAQGKPLPAQVAVFDAGRPIGTHHVAADGRASFSCPATATFAVSAKGFKDRGLSVFHDSRVYDYSLNMNEVWPSFYTPEAWQVLRQMLSDVTFKVVMEK